MERDLRLAEKGEIQFPAEKYVNKVPVKKHDHVAIPAGTIHCSGKIIWYLKLVRHHIFSHLNFGTGACRT